MYKGSSEIRDRSQSLVGFGGVDAFVAVFVSFLLEGYGPISVSSNVAFGFPETVTHGRRDVIYSHPEN